MARRWTIETAGRLGNRLTFVFVGLGLDAEDGDDHDDDDDGGGGERHHEPDLAVERFALDESVLDIHLAWRLHLRQGLIIISMVKTEKLKLCYFDFNVSDFLV